MASTITITFNPALDKCTTIPVLIPHSKMRCSTPVCYPGGGGVNVARAIKKLGGEALALYLAGGYTGKAFQQLLGDEGVESMVTEISENTRDNLIVMETDTSLQYRFGMPGPHILEKEWKECLSGIERMQGVSYIVASGSLPPGVPTDIFARIAFIAKKNNARFIVDTSGEALKQAIQEGVFMIKPSLTELGYLAGKSELQIELVNEEARKVIDHGNCRIVVVSMGASGAMLITKDMAIQIMSPVVKIKSTVGAGDSMVAGMVLSLERNKSLIETVQYGVACGSAATMNPGTDLCRKEDADYLYNLIRNKMSSTPIP